jgi:SRSO17 transposase
LVIDETGDKKKGKTTDYVDRQYIGNLGKVENKIVLVNAYGVLDGLTFPLIFKIFKPQKRLTAIFKSMEPCFDCRNRSLLTF